MASKDKLSFTITDGPEKSDLATSLFGSNPDRKIILFKVRESKQNIPILIEMVKRNDSFRESWDFQGNTQFVNMIQINVEGRFCTKDKSGSLNFRIPSRKWWNHSLQEYQELTDPELKERIERFADRLHDRFLLNIGWDADDIL
jgi:hypothetical protein